MGQAQMKMKPSCGRSIKGGSGVEKRAVGRERKNSVVHLWWIKRGGRA